MELLSQVGNIQELIENPFDFLSSSLEENCLKFDKKRI
jgi:hypothetical protein